MEDFVRWSLKYDLWCKMNFFGEAIENQEESATTTKKTGPKNLLDLLPIEFTREEARTMRKRHGIRRGNVQMMLDNWRKRGHIVVIGELRPKDISSQLFAKTEAYLKDHPQDASVSQSISQFIFFPLVFIIIDTWDVFLID